MSVPSKGIVSTRKPKKLGLAFPFLQKMWRASQICTIYRFLLLINFAVLFLFLVGCNLMVPVGGTTQASTESICTEPEETFNSYSFEQFQKSQIDNSRFIYILVEQLDGSSQEMTERANMVREQVVPRLVPGDRLVVAWIPKEATSASILFDRTIPFINVSSDYFPPTPTPPSLLPTPTRGGTTTQLGLQEIKSNEIESENDLKQLEYECAIAEWNSISNSIYQEFEQQETDNLSAISDEVNSILLDSTLVNTSNNNDFFSGLELASEVMRLSIDQSQFVHNQLLVLSNIDSIEPENRALDLTGIDTFVIADECVYNSECTVKELWENKFMTFGTSPHFVSSEQLASYIFDSVHDCDLDLVETDPGILFRQDPNEYIFVLVDKTYGHSEYLAETLDLIEGAIVTNLSPGDKLVMAWVDLDATTDSSIFFNKSLPAIEIPEIPQRPSVQQAEESICSLKVWENSVNALHKEWLESHKRSVDEIVHEISQAMSSPSYSGGKLIYESFELVSRLILDSQQVGEQYERYTLFVFSNMEHEWRDNKPSHITINLQDVNVYLFALSCQYRINCTGLKNRWENEIRNFGVEDVRFLTSEDNIYQFINEYMLTNAP